MRLTLIALCLMAAIAADAKSGNNGIELPDWILEPEEGLFIGISFPGEGREQALAFAEFSMYLGQQDTVDAALESRSRWGTNDDFSNDYGHNVLTVKIEPTTLHYDIVKETELPSGEYAVAIRKGSSITKQTKADLMYDSMSVGRSISYNITFNLSFGTELLCIKKTATYNFQLIQTSDGYVYSNSSRPNSYRLPAATSEIMRPRSDNTSEFINAHTLHFCSNEDPISISLLYGNIEMLTRYCTQYCLTGSSIINSYSGTSTSTMSSHITFIKRPVFYYRIFLDNHDRKNNERLLKYIMPEQCTYIYPNDIISISE